jgi:hypothetical protein
MKNFALLITFFFIATSTRAAIEAGPFVNPANGHTYYLLTSNTWTNSEAEAVALGGHLVTINDAAENQWVVNTFANYGGVARPLWIGLTDRDSEGNFGWVSGEPFTYSNWNLPSGEPNNSGGSGYEEDFTYIIQDFPGNPTVFPTFWNDVPNDGFGVIPPMHGVVEVSSPVVPVPIPVVRHGQLCWQTVPGVAYQAQWKPAKSRGKWVRFGPAVIGTGGEVCVKGSPRPRDNFIYRVQVLE